MAEERLIDDDKDKKYKIKINADGEEELIVEESEEGEAEPEEVMFVSPEEKEDDGGEEALLTPEQLAAKREQEERERAEKLKKQEELLSKARADVAVNKFATALEYLEKAEEIYDENGEIYALRIRAYTRKFTDFSQVTVAAESADDLKEYASDELKQGILKTAAPELEKNIADLRGRVSNMNKQNEEKKAERAVKFIKDRNIALIVFACIMGALIVFGALTGYFASVIYTVSNGLYLGLTIAFGALSFIALIAAAFAARRINITCRRVNMNKRNTSTQLGRDLLSEQAKLKAFIAIYSALKGEE